ncbi:serendipity locus protein delta-like [Cochliomyia hominivorax]
MSAVGQDFIRCYLCRKKSAKDKLYKSIDDALCPASKKAVKTVLLYLARVGKFELHISNGEYLCRKCFGQIADYDLNFVTLNRKQKQLSLMVEKAATSFESDIEDECLQEMSSMPELNDEHFFEDANVSDREITETILEVMGANTIRKRSQESHQHHQNTQREGTDNHGVFETNQSHISEQIQCNLCAMRFKTRARLQRHVVQAHKKFSCNVCSFSHRNEDYVMLHMNIHEGKNENQCRFCNKEFTTKISTIRHMEVHMDTKKYQCDKCGLCFSQTTVLYNHKLQHEAEEKPLRCEICNQIFKTKRTFRHHMVTHQADRPRYSCEFCGKTFTEKYTLKVHKRSHPEAGITPPAGVQYQQQQHQNYEIESDQHQSFNQNQDDYMQSNVPSTNSQKTTTTTTTSKFSCIICDQPFTTKDHLNKHMEKEHDVILKSLTIANFTQYDVVTNEPKKPCHICGQIFSAQHNLEYHLEHMHGVAFK